MKYNYKQNRCELECDFYVSMQNEHLEKKDFSIQSMFYEFMKHKANEVNSGTVKRMMADWTRFYEPENDIVNIG